MGFIAEWLTDRKQLTLLLLTISVLIFSVLLHETCHVAAAFLVGGSGRVVSISKCVVSYPPSALNDIVVKSAGGIGSGIILALVFAFLVGKGVLEGYAFFPSAVSQVFYGFVETAFIGVFKYPMVLFFIVFTFSLIPVIHASLADFDFRRSMLLRWQGDKWGKSLKRSREREFHNDMAELWS